MKKQFFYFVAILFCGTVVSLTSCDKDDDPVDAGESTIELLVKKFDAAPSLDGDIDDMWGEAQRLVGDAEVPDLAARGTYLNSDGEGVEEGLGLFDPYTGEVESFSLGCPGRAG